MASGSSDPNNIPISFIRELLELGADPNQRGMNDYAPLHIAVREHNLKALKLLLFAGADPALRTRIDDFETPVDLADGVGAGVILAVLRRGSGRKGDRRMDGVRAIRYEIFESEP